MQPLRPRVLFGHRLPLLLLRVQVRRMRRLAGRQGVRKAAAGVSQVTVPIGGDEEVLLGL